MPSPHVHLLVRLPPHWRANARANQHSAAIAEATPVTHSPAARPPAYGRAGNPSTARPHTAAPAARPLPVRIRPRRQPVHCPSAAPCTAIRPQPSAGRAAGRAARRRLPAAGCRTAVTGCDGQPRAAPRVPRNPADQPTARGQCRRSGMSALAPACPRHRSPALPSASSHPPRPNSMVAATTSSGRHRCHNHVVPRRAKPRRTWPIGIDQVVVRAGRAERKIRVRHALSEGCDTDGLCRFAARSA